MTQADVLVVGAGPAGSAAALVLARAGLRVRMIDRVPFPRHKLCGDTLNPGSLALLDRLCEGDARGVCAAVLSRSLPIRGMTLTGPRGARVTAEYPHGLHGAAIARRELDQLLIDAAITAGACVEHGVTATAPLMSADESRVVGVRAAATGRSYTLNARVVIAADGRGSRLASGSRLSSFAHSPRRWAYGAYFTDMEGLTAHGEMHLRADGYVGVAPLPGGVTNVCVVRDLSHVRARGLESAQVVCAALRADPVLKARVTRARQVSEVTSLGPLAVDGRAAGCPGLLLAGDAAGFIDPMTGDGLRFALRGGMLAAEAALTELESGRPACHNLAQARAREFLSKWRFNRALRSLVASPRALELAALAATRCEWPFQYLIRVAGDVALARAESRAPLPEPRPDPRSPIPERCALSHRP